MVSPTSRTTYVVHDLLYFILDSLNRTRQIAWNLIQKNDFWLILWYQYVPLTVYELFLKLSLFKHEFVFYGVWIQKKICAMKPFQINWKLQRIFSSFSSLASFAFNWSNVATLFFSQCHYNHDIFDRYKAKNKPIFFWDS